MDYTVKNWIYHTVASDGEINFSTRKLATIDTCLNASDDILAIKPDYSSPFNWWQKIDPKNPQPAIDLAKHRKLAFSSA